MRAGIIAAGWGTRLGGGPKALTPVGDRTLIDRVLDGIVDAGADSVTIIVNEASAAVCEHVGRAWPGLAVEWIVRTTPTSMHSFLAVLEWLGAGGGEGFLVTTVDSVCSVGTTREFVRQASALGAPLALGVTTVIDDEKPLYAVPREAGVAADAREPFRIGALSSRRDASSFVTAGFYWASPSILSERDRSLTEGFTALRQFLGAVVEAGHVAWGVPLPPVIDVDRPQDVAAALRLMS
jgi:NDP-sugar pyrophosphorylase family protein